MMDATVTTEMSLHLYQTTRFDNPEDSHLQTRRRENLQRLREGRNEAEVLRIEHDRMKVSLREALSIAATSLLRDSFINEPCTLTSVFAYYRQPEVASCQNIYSATSRRPLFVPQHVKIRPECVKTLQKKVTLSHHPLHKVHTVLASLFCQF
jgi:hypothetical protein